MTMKSKMIRLASPMHDIGKIATPDEILKKPGKLTAEEYEVMKEHAVHGYNIFKNSNREMMVTAAIIAPVSSTFLILAVTALVTR